MLIIDSIDTSSSYSKETFNNIKVCTITISNVQEQITIECGFSAEANDVSLMLEQRILWKNILNYELLFGKFKKIQ